MTLALIRSATRLSGSTELAEVSSKSEPAACPAWVPDPASPDIWCRGRGRGRGRGDDFRVGCMVGLRVHPCESVVSLPPLRSLRSLWLNPPPQIRVNSCPFAVKSLFSVSSVCSLWKISARIRVHPCASVVMIRIKTGNGGDRFSGFAPHFSAIRGLISRRLRRFARNNSQGGLIWKPRMAESMKTEIFHQAEPGPNVSEGIGLFRAKPVLPDWHRGVKRADCVDRPGWSRIVPRCPTSDFFRDEAGQGLHRMLGGTNPDDKGR
jgi:hypothetical protein